MGNRTRKLLTVGVIAAMTLSMAACTSGNDTSSSSGSSDKKRQKPEQVRLVLQCRQKTYRDGIRTART